MRKQIIILLLGLLIGSCSTGNDFFVVPVKTFGEFPVNGMLAVRDTLAVPGLGGVGLAVSDSLLIVGKSGTDSFLSVVNLNDNTICDNLCLHGRGPGEYSVFFTCYKQFSRNGNDIMLYTFDVGRSMLLINLSSSLCQRTTVVSDEESIKNFAPFAHGIFYLKGDELFVKYNTSYQDARDNQYFPAKYVLYDKQQKKETEFPFFGPGMVADNMGFLVRTATDGSVLLKPDGTKIVDAMLNFGYINFIDLEKLTGFTLRKEDALTYEAASGLSNEERMRRMRFAYFDLAVTDRYVFAAYCGNTYEAGFDSPDNITTLRVFDWDGNPLASMQFDRKIKGIAFREQTGLLYGLDADENIVTYDLNELLKKIGDEI